MPHEWTGDRTGRPCSAGPELRVQNVFQMNQIGSAIGAGLVACPVDGRDCRGGDQLDQVSEARLC